VSGSFDSRINLESVPNRLRARKGPQPILFYLNAVIPNPAAFLRMAVRDPLFCAMKHHLRRKLLLFCEAGAKEAKKPQVLKGSNCYS
jgi:hypothetical protein